MSRFFLFSIYIFLIIKLSAQTFSASLEKQPVAVGEAFMIEYTLQGAAGVNFVMPDYDNSAFFLLEENQAQQIIETNGKKAITTTFALTFKPLQPGTHTFSPATVTIDGIHRKLRSNSIEVQVENAKGFQQQQPQNQNQPQQAQTTSSSDDVILLAVPSKKIAYLGEPILLTYKLLTRKNLSQPKVTDNPQYAGFWRDDLETRASKGQVEMYQGKRFTAYEVKRELLYPQKSGNLVIPTFGLQLEMEAGNQSWLERMMGVPAPHQTVQVNSQALAIQVKPLPTTSQPANYNGWVGNFKADFLLLNEPAKVGEPLQLNITLAGKGNLRMANPPKWEVGSDFETYEPEIEDHLHKETHDVTGFKIFKYSFIPNKAGTFTLPPLKLYFFDYEQNKYDSIFSPAYTIKVFENENIVASSPNTQINENGDSLIFHTNMPVSTLLNWKSENPSLFWFWAILANVGLGFLLISFYEKRKTRLFQTNKNIYEKWEKAQQYLTIATKYLGEEQAENFYENLLFCLKTALQHHLNLPNISFQKAEIMDKMEAINKDKILIENILSIWKTCESALFGKKSSTISHQELYAEMQDILQQLR